METPDFFDVDAPEPGAPTPTGYLRPAAGGLWAAGETITSVGALVLMLSSFMDWYAGNGEGITLSVIGWHSGLLGKLVFFVGFLILLLLGIRALLGLELLPPQVPESLLVLALAVLGLVFVVIRLISIPDAVLPANGRGIGIWISLLAALATILGAVLTAAEEL